MRLAHSRTRRRLAAITSKASIRVVLMRPITRQKPRRMFWVLGLRKLPKMLST